MDFNSYIILIIGVGVGLLSGGVVWFIWRKYHSQSSHASPTLEPIAADESLHRRLGELTILHAIATAGSEATDEDELIERATQIIGENLYPNNFGLLLIDKTGEKLRTHPSYRERDELKGPEWISIGEGICGQVAADGEPRRVADVSQEENYIEVDKSTCSELCVPMRIGGRVIGVINAESELIDGFTDSDQRLLSTIAGQLAIAIDRLRAESVVYRRASQLSILSSIGQEIVASLIPNQVYSAIHRAANQLMSVEIFLIVLLDEKLNELQTVYYSDQNLSNPSQPIPAHQDLSRYVLSAGDTLLINDRTELGNIGVARIMDEVGTSSILAVPLRLGDKIFGMLSSQSYQPHAYTPDDLSTLITLANQSAIAIENARLFEETQQRLAELTFLSRIIAITATENDLTVALNLICSELARFLEVPEVNFALLNAQLTIAQVIAEYHDPDRPESLGMQIPIIGNPVMASVLESGTYLSIEDTGSDLLLRASQEEISQRGVSSLLLVPIIFGGEVVGTLEIASLTSRQFTQSDIALVEKVSSQVGQVLERLGLFAATRDQAERMAQLATISEGLNRPLTPDEVINSIGEGAMVLGQSDRTALYLRKGDGTVIAPWFKGFSERYISQVTGSVDDLPGQILFHSSEPVLISDIKLFPEDSLLKAVGLQEGFRAIHLWPLVYKDDVVAAIGCYYDEPHVGSEAEQDVMLAFARQAAVALVNARLFDETRRRTAQLEALNAIITEVTVASDLEHLLRIALDHTLRALGVQMGAIWVGDQHVIQDMPAHVGELFAQLNLEVARGNSVAITIPDWGYLNEGDRYYAYKAAMEEFDIQASVIVPLISEGRRMGGLSVASQRPRNWLAEEIALIEGVGLQLGGAVERIALLERIQENAQQVQHIIDTVPEGVILFDEEKRVVLANPVAQEYLHNLTDHQAGDVVSHFGETPLEDLLTPEYPNIWHEIEISGPPHQLFEVGAQPIESGSRPGGWVVVLREVSHERETQSLIQMHERLATVGQLAAGIAHDFNNILAAIVVYADLLSRDPNLLPASQERLDIIHQQVQRAASLIRQILDFSRRSVMEQSTLELLPFVKELDKLLRRVLPETIRLELTYQPGVYLINADPTRLQQVFMNLAVNARDASPNGGVLKFNLGHVKVEEGESPPCPEIPPGSWNRISVIDSGEGIPPEVLPHIFEPFFTTKPVGQGTGLGLAQAYGIIKQHGGFIDAHSQVGEGATFHIYLPAQQPVVDEIDSFDSIKDARGSGETLLLVEDDLSTLKALKTLLVDSNYQVLEATNGLEALEIYEERAKDIDLVVSDMVMPEMGGVALYETLREHWPGVKVLFITGHPVIEQDQSLLESGNVYWLQKPFSVGEFGKAVLSLLK
jgi:GAF domain-containing protein/signal transduction histidine kinase/CheY-like chemotaxis protein